MTGDRLSIWWVTVSDMMPTQIQDQNDADQKMTRKSSGSSSKKKKRYA